MAKKKKEEKEEIHEHIHYHYDDWGKVLIQLFIWVIAFIVIINVMQFGIAKLQEDRLIYNKCADSCKVKYFSGVKIGDDARSNACFVEEFDRTQCIKNCNILYSSLKSD